MVINEYLQGNQEYQQILQQYWNDNPDLQKLHEEFSENTITNFYMPYGIAPNFLIDGKLMALPMAVEESSVVAAASKSAKFWLERGGFKTTIINTEKLGHTHFIFKVEAHKLLHFFNFTLKKKLFEATEDITANMRKRGGGILDIKLIDKTSELADYYQLKASFNTVDSMGANFINSCLEQFGKTLKEEVAQSDAFSEDEKNSLQIVMNILSNFTPDCIVRAEVSCKIDDLKDDSGISNEEFAWKFKQAVTIAEIEPYRATTHNKGVMNGIDAVVIATGNDFRATEACAHAYASKDGKYKSLTHCTTRQRNFQILDRFTDFCWCSWWFNQSSSFSEIQKGHMKMHLFNILNQFGATEEEKQYFVNYFKDKTVSHHEVISELNKLRNK